MRLVLLGAPGSGKGTQANLLVSKFRIPQISSGDLLREALAAGSDLGKRARQAMDAGHLVSDEIVLAFICERLRKPDAKRGFVLDGFPRNLSQAQALDTMLDDNDWPLDVAVLMEVDHDQLMQRLVGRRTCTKCHRVYNVFSSPPQIEGRCDYCGHALHHRADDNEETIGNRLRVYELQTRPLITYFDLQDKLVRLDAVGGIQEIFKRLTAAIKPYARRRGKGVAKPRPAAPIKPAADTPPASEKTRVKKRVAVAVNKTAGKKAATKKVAKKTVAEKKVTKKKAASKKVVRKKATKKKAVKKTTARKSIKKKTARRKAAKKVVRKKAAKKITRKKANKKKVSKKRVARKVTRKKTAVKKVVGKKAAKKKVTKKKATRKKAVARKTTKKKPARKKAAKKTASRKKAQRKKPVKKTTRRKKASKKKVSKKKASKKKASKKKTARKPTRKKTARKKITKKKKARARR